MPAHVFLLKVILGEIGRISARENASFNFNSPYLDFKKGYETDGVELVDMYQLMAFLLDVNPNPHHGNWDRYNIFLSLF